MSKNRIRFSRLDTIGTADAESDNLLAENFIDTGYLDVIRNFQDPRNILLGRTGSGKSALLRHIAENESRVLPIRPENLALSYITNSNILNYLLSLGVRFDLFFKLLWRHVISVEIIKTHLHLSSGEAVQNWLFSFLQGTQSKKNKEAITYLKQWGSKFWEETDFRIKEITDKFTSELEARLGKEFLGVRGALRSEKTQTAEVVKRAQSVVNDIQVVELAKIIDLLDSVLDDDQKKYFVIIDSLDENWIIDSLRYLMIRALIEASKDFKKVRNLKIIVALRDDLLNQVYENTRDRGFQKEKYESLCLHVTWTRSDLKRIIESRLNALLRSKNQIQSHIELDEVLPRSIDRREKPMDYIIDRTLMRPRDMISFFNMIIRRADRKMVFTAHMIRDAESEYSESRFNALADEWFSDFPNFIKATRLLRHRKPIFNITDLTQSECDDFCLELQTEDLKQSYKLGALYLLSKKYVDENMEFQKVRSELVNIFFEMGIVGLRFGKGESTVFYMDEYRDVRSSKIDNDTKIAIHKAFWRALGVGTQQD